MGISERREREKEEIKKKILDAARELFTTEGYERVTIRRIAEAIEYSPTTIYHHFEDKDDLVRALCHADFGRLLEAMQLAPAPADPIEAIRLLGRAYVAFALQNPNQYRFMFMTPVVKEELDAESPGNLSFGHLLAAVKRAADAGRLRPIDPVLAAQILWMSVHGPAAALITLAGEHWPHAPAAPDLTEQVMANALRGLLADPGRA
ncbi:MAG: TetR/AcrR family transcriptional regulator [Betaproteobacteria bacterium]